MSNVEALIVRMFSGGYINYTMIRNLQDSIGNYLGPCIMYYRGPND